MKLIRIVIVDDHVLLRDGISSIFKGLPDFEVVGEAGSVAEAIHIVRAQQPDLVLMDYSLPDGTGLEATKEILAFSPQTNVVILTIHEEDDLLFSAVRYGAKGYLLKNIPATEMVSKLRGLSNGDPALSPVHTGRILNEFAKISPTPVNNSKELVLLTDRELEVLQLIVNGASNRKIAEKLFISIHTVKNHVHNILDKLEVDNRLQAADVAVAKGLVKTK